MDEIHSNEVGGTRMNTDERGSGPCHPCSAVAKLILRSGGFFVVLGGVKTKDVLSLAGAWIDCPQVLATLHFPNRRHYSIFFHCMVSNFFGARFGRGLVCFGRAFA